MSEPRANPDEAWSSWAGRRPAFAGTHLDAAASGRMSHAVLAAVNDHLNREAQVGAYVAQEQAATAITACRAELGSLLGVPADGVAFVESATSALSALLLAWPFPEDASVAVAPSEWGPNLRAFRMRGLDLRRLPVDGAGLIDLDALPAHLSTDRPSLVHVTQVAAHRGLIQPVAEIIRVCHAAGVAVWVDAAQALGHVDASCGADAVLATSRKWLCGPRGVGVLGVAERWWAQLRVDPLDLAPDSPVVARLESGEANIAGRLGLSVAVREYLSHGPAAVEHRLACVGSQAREALSALPGWRLVPSPAGSGAIVAVEPTDGRDVIAERRRLLSEHQILVTASQPARAPWEMTRPSLRISPHVELTSTQLEALTRALSPARSQFRPSPAPGTMRPMTSAPPPQVWPTLRAADAPALIRFLVDVVGFREVVVYADGDVVHHAQLAWPLGGGIMLGSTRADDEDDAWSLQPGCFGAYVVAEDIDALHARVAAAGAEITQAPHDTDYGSRDFALRDPEGNRWSFGTYRGEPG